MTDVREQIERPRLAPISHGPIRSANALCNLTRTIETRIIPSLIVAHTRPASSASALVVDRGNVASSDAAALAEQVLAGASDDPTVRINMLRAQGHTLEEIYLQLLAPAAAHLRRMWTNDLCGFAEATLGLWRLQQLLRNYSVEFRAEAKRRETGWRALLAPTPREKHDLSYTMFCLVLISEFFRRDGWDAWIEPEPTSREFVEVIRGEWFDVVEFLVSGDKQLDALASRIRMIRRELPNRSIGIMVHGQIFIEHPELALLVGADLTATDASQGALQAQQLVGLNDRS